MYRIVLFVGLFMLGFASGCEGKKNGLATDSGEMTIEEYTAMQAAQEASLSESMKAPAK